MQDKLSGISFRAGGTNSNKASKKSAANNTGSEFTTNTAFEGIGDDDL